MKTRITMEGEIACLDISPLDEDKANFCAVGNWGDISVSYGSDVLVVTVVHLGEFVVSAVAGCDGQVAAAG